MLHRQARTLLFHINLKFYHERDKIHVSVSCKLNKNIKKTMYSSDLVYYHVLNLLSLTSMTESLLKSQPCLVPYL